MRTKSKSNFGKKEVITLALVVGIVGAAAVGAQTVANNGADAAYLKPGLNTSVTKEAKWLTHADSTQFATKNLIARSTNQGLRFISTVGNTSDASVNPSSERGLMSLYLTPDFFKLIITDKAKPLQGTFTYLGTDGTYITDSNLNPVEVRFTTSDNQQKLIVVSTKNAYLNGQPAALDLQIYYTDGASGPTFSNNSIPANVKSIAMHTKYLAAKSTYAEVNYNPAPASGSTGGAYFMPNDTMLDMTNITLNPSPSQSPINLFPTPTGMPPKR